jgi:ElaA protein
MEIIAKSFNELSALEIFEIYKLRCKVFVVEQNCAYQDVDDKDLSSVHVTIRNNNQLLAYCRILPPGISYSSASIGRVVVPIEERKNGYAKKLMHWSINYCIQKFPQYDIIISAQSYLIAFYNELEFKVEGETYLEDNIPHVKMRLKINSSLTS